MIEWHLTNISDVGMYPTSPLRAGCDTRSIFKWITAGLNSEFSFADVALASIKSLVCPTIYLYLWVGKRTAGFLPLQRTLTSRIRSRTSCYTKTKAYSLPEGPGRKNGFVSLTRALAWTEPTQVDMPLNMIQTQGLDLNPGRRLNFLRR